MVIADRAVVTNEREVHIEVLDPAAWGHVLVGLSVQSGPVFYATQETANMHEVEMTVWECPRQFRIIDTEKTIRSNPGWLSGAEVCRYTKDQQSPRHVEVLVGRIYLCHSP